MIDSKRKKYDLVVIGAGPAGITAAYEALKNGLKVMLINDQVMEEKDKLCGGLLTNKTIQLIKKVYEEVDVDNWDIVDTQNVKFTSNSEEIITADLGAPISFVNRKGFDYSLYEAYLKRGGTFLKSKVDASQIDIKNKKISIDGVYLEYDNLIVGAGASNNIVNLINSDYHPNAAALEVFLPTDKAPDQAVIDFGLFDKNQGYGWVFPKKDHVVIGVGADTTDGNILREKLNQLVKNEGYEPTSKFRGAAIPYGSFPEKTVDTSGSIFLIGDSAGMVDSVTGEGIYYAILSGEQAVKCIVRNKDNPHYAKEEYEKFSKEVFQNIKAGNLIRLGLVGTPKETRKIVYSMMRRFSGFVSFFYQDVVNNYNHLYKDTTPLFFKYLIENVKNKKEYNK